VASLIEGRFEEKPQSSERAKLLGWDRESRYRLCSILLDEPNPLSRKGFEKRERVAASASHSLQRRNVRPILSLSANQIHLLVPETLDVDAWWSDFPVSRLSMGVSQINSGVDGMRKAGIEVAALIEHLKPGRVHHFDELLFPRVLRGDLEAQRKFIDRLFGSLGEGKRTRALLDTALALGEKGFHLQRTAELLGIHISTLRYRLNRLSDLTGLDLETVEGRFRLQVGARLFLMNET
jgi:purine catabolism regulator